MFPPLSEMLLFRRDRAARAGNAGIVGAGVLRQGAERLSCCHCRLGGVGSGDYDCAIRVMNFR